MVDVRGPSCQQCGKPLSDDGQAGDERAPCPRCGSVARSYAIHKTAEVRVHSLLDLKHRRPGIGGVLIHLITGIAKSVDHRWVRFFRLIDKSDKANKANYRYTERVETLDGRVIHECDEPLADHWGHGSDKARRPKDE